MEIDWAAERLFLHPIILLALISSISIYLLRYFSGKNFTKKITYYPPELQPYAIIGHLPHFLRHRHRFLDWMTELLTVSPTNTIVLHRPGNIHGVVTANPANVEHFLKSHFDNYPNGERFRAILHDLLGRGIFNADGANWRLQRKTASFEFKTRSLRTFVHHAVDQEIAARLIPFLHRAAETGATIDLQDTLERFAFDNICKIAFDVDPACLDSSRLTEGFSPGFAAAFRDATELSAGRFRYAVPGFWRVKKMLNVGSERRLRESIATVHDFAMQIIRSRKKDLRLRSVGGGGDDLLSRFIADEENNSDEFLRDIIISFILAGRETTSSALAWFFWLLSSRPDVERRILAEVSTVRAAGLGLGFDGLHQMHYLHAAVAEAMRLFPPVPFNSAVCCADDVLPDGTEIKKGWFISYNAYAMGRLEAIWGKDCKEFRPERWLEVAGGAFRAESPFRFPAFHGGARMCLGKEMAYVQMKSIVACVIERFELQVLIDKNTRPDPILSLTLRMRGGLPVRVSGRHPTAIKSGGDVAGAPFDL